MQSQTTSIQTRPATGEIDSQTLRQVIGDLRRAVDVQLDHLVGLGISAPFVVGGLAHLEGLLATFGELAESWRPSDLLGVLHTDLEAHIADQRRIVEHPSLGAYSGIEQETEDPVPDRHRSESRESSTHEDVFGADGVRLEPSPGLSRGLA